MPDRVREASAVQVAYKNAISVAFHSV